MIAVVAIEVTPLEGSSMAAAFQQGYGEEFLLAYLSTKMPAGSPVAIRTVTIVPEEEGGR